ncbi:hypothetical protein BST27_12750 [Mycobacterium intermedium]|uniref:Transposase n=1 Tax=Mycobacterium intermedium TaxID=28445 RepID=A0A1E3SAF9_MYCIE|nr:hypothetical protein BHQ20_18825 [Mycobacterium intermedium]OPE50555.1 hypothetical protein BV508_09760 [Mycobacterium intermedium]ORB05500.1 hypothetical protein BST27_12750 [Mycobacterium intermedium]
MFAKHPRSDRGSQFVVSLGLSGMVGSMRSVRAAGDNASMECFFALLQNNDLDRRRWEPVKNLCRYLHLNRAHLHGDVVRLASDD